jgi:DNA-binding MarR family transcriptional regulator
MQKPLDLECERVFEEVLALGVSLRRRAAQGSGRPARSLSKRAILKLLREHADGLTVPQLARHRGSSRQNLQVLVDALAKEGQVQFLENPDHCRSPRVKLTENGRRTLKRPGQVLPALPAGLTVEDLRKMRLLLRGLRAGVDGKAWTALAEGVAATDSGEQVGGVAPRPVAGPVEEGDRATDLQDAAPQELPVSLL